MKAFLKPLAAVGSVMALAISLGEWYARDLPSPDDLRPIRSQLREDKHREWLPLSDISSRLPAAILVSEDVAFYRHHGFNFAELWNSLVEDLRAGRYRRGGSTITQQVAKNLLPAREKTLRRKLREAILAHRLEQAFSKDEILEIYLNLADWGDGVQGASAAARLYLDKSSGDLTWADAALLAGMLPNPRRFSPAQSCGPALFRRNLVLAKLHANGDITADDLAQALSAACPRPAAGMGKNSFRPFAQRPVLRVDF